MNLLKRVSIIFLGSLCVINSLYAQSITQPDLNRSLIPPSPDAASIAKFGILPVTLYEGMPNSTVPIYEMKVGKLSLPINLSYHYNGYRPGEEASWIGLGWTLQAQGVITRQVKGLVDNVWIPNMVHQWADFANVLDLTNNPDFMQLVAGRQIDVEPDIYVFSFPGHAGKFLITGSRIFVFPHQDLVVTQVGNGFSIMDENGTHYNFNPTGAETTYPNNSTNPGFYTPTYLSSWNLTSIVSTDNNDEIDFQYTPFTHHQANNSYSETYTQKYGTIISNGVQTSCTHTNSSCDAWSQNIYPGGNIDARRLSGISCKNSYINFVPEATSRQDLNSVQAFALKEIDIYSLPDSGLVKRLKLNHAYFTDATGAKTQLKLSSVDLVGHSLTSTDSIVMPAYYSFQYANETSGGFPKGTRGIDKYGYYNGADANVMLFDQSLFGYTPLYPTANRDVNSSASVNGIMTKMTYPTGGYSTFAYEKNQLNIPGTPQTQNMHTGLFVVNHGGNPETNSQTFTLNVEQDIHINYSRDISNNSNNWVHNYIPIIKIYLPGSDTIPITPPTLLYSCHLLNPGASSNTPPPDVLHLLPGTYYYVVSCELSTVSAEGDINYIQQLNYTPPTDGPGLRIKTITSYDTINPATPAITRNYNYPTLGTILALDSYGFQTVDHFCSGYQGCPSWEFWENVITSNYGSPLASLINNQFYYDSVIEVNSDGQGSGMTSYKYTGSGSAMDVELMRQTDFSFLSGTYKMIHQKTNIYSVVSGINFSGFTCNLLRINEGCTMPLADPYVYVFDTLARYKYYQPNAYAFGTEYIHLTATDEINTDKDGNNPLTVHSDYYYDNPDYMQPSRIVANNSKGEIITTQTKYPLDYAISPCAYPNRQQAIFDSTRFAVSIAYQQCAGNRYNAAYPSITGPATYYFNSQNAALLNVLRQYKCEDNYPGQYSTALNSINYPSCPSQPSGTLAQSAIGYLLATHVLTPPVEQITSLNKTGTPNLISANKTDYLQTGLAINPQIIYQTTTGTSDILLSDFTANPNNYYSPRINFVGNSNGNIIEQSKQNDMKMAYVWDYNRDHVIAQCTNGGASNIAYTSFEADGTGNFSFSGTITSSPGNAFTGNKYYTLNTGSITMNNVNAGTVYIVSYWSKNGSYSVTGSTAISTGRTFNNWTYYEHSVSNMSSIVISGTGLIDELRLYPKGALMETFTYNPVLGLTGKCDANNHVSTYEYDALSRLKIVRDENRNILKQYDYKYSFDPTTASNTNPIWQNTSITQCKPCSSNPSYISNILQQQQIDINPQSPTYNQTQFIDIGPSAGCAANASWVNVSPAVYMCVVKNNQNTGEQLQEQQDINPCSTTYLQYNWVSVGANLTACPLPSSCLNCTAPSQKCIGGVCQTGTKVYTSSTYNKSTGLWTCVYHWLWSDGSISVNYSETSTKTCI